MSNIAIYDPSDALVANRVTAYHQSVNTPDYDGVTDKLVNPTTPAGPWRHWKHDAGALVEMSQAEKDLIDRYVPDKAYEIKTYATNGRLETIDWYQDAAYTILSEKHTYTWQGSNLISVVRDIYYSDGTVESTETDTFFTDGLKRIKKTV